jgi:DNA-binding winged helix-turn-helix (wHTH) protein
MSDQHGKVLSFGPFELSIGNRLLTNGAKVIPLGARAMDLLIVLLEQANKVVGRRTLIERVWPKRGAEQVSLASTSQRCGRLSIRVTLAGDISRTCPGVGTASSYR